MKTTICFALLTLSLSAQARTVIPDHQPTVPYPEFMACQELSLVFGERDLDSSLMWALKSDEFRGVTQNPLDNKFVVDYSQDHKIDFSQFKRSDMYDLNFGAVDSIKGVRSLGTWYSEGDFIESMSVVECKVSTGNPDLVYGGN